MLGHVGQVYVAMSRIAFLEPQKMLKCIKRSGCYYYLSQLYSNINDNCRTVMTIQKRKIKMCFNSKNFFMAGIKFFELINLIE